MDSLLRRWTGELAASLGRKDPSEGIFSREELEQLFSRLLHQAAAGRRVVCIIDALNQFERTPAARFLTWLPKDWPENACLLAFAIPGDETAALKARQAALIELGPLAREDIESIARKAHARRRQPYRASVIQVLTGRKQADSSPSAGVPLWLDLALGELLALDADDYAAILARPERTHEQKVEAHLVEKAKAVPAEVEDLYGLMLDRLEEHHGKDLARAFASLIALSRTGWRFSDLKGLLPLVTEAGWDELQIAGLRAGFRNQLVQRGVLGQWDFAHVRLRQAVERRNLGNEADRKRLHSRIADFLETLPPNDGLRAAGLMFHYIGADDKTRAARLFGQPLQGADLAGAVQALARHITAGLERRPNPGLEFIRLMLEEKALTGEETRLLGNNCMFYLHDALLSDARLEHRLELLLLVHSRLDRLARSDPDNALWQRDLSVSYSKLGDIYVAQGDIPKALKAYEAALAIADRLARSDPDNAEWQYDLGISHERLGAVLQARGDLQGALEAFQRKHGIIDRLARSDPDNAQWQRDLAVSFYKLAQASGRAGDRKKEMDCLRRCRDVLRRMKAKGMHLDPPAAQVLEQLEQLRL